MKKFLLFAFLLFAGSDLFAQNDSLLHWQVHVKRINKNIYELTASTPIAKGWHVYKKNEGVDITENIQFAYDYENAKSAKEAEVQTATLEIDDAVSGKKINVYIDSIHLKQLIEVDSAAPESMHVFITAFLGRKDEFITVEDTLAIKLEGGIAATADAKQIRLASIDRKNPVNDCGDKDDLAQNSLWKIFLLGFLGGLIALLTPCVFPMIPITVSFFTNRSPDRNSAIKNGLLYGFFILLIYVLASLPFHLLGGVNPEIFNNISTNAWLNIIFFIIFIVFAISFFGYFNIDLPSSIANRADSKTNLGSIGGIFFMALTLAIVSFSCTGPILGTLLVGSLSGGAMQLTSGFAGFGLALALPFALFAVFPHWLKSLPKSGGWLDTVKKFLAFAELALALKFLSNADLVMHWGILKREVFIGLWIIIGICLTLYLFGIIRLPHDYKGMKIGRGRKIAGVLVLLFTLYLVPGITSSKYANLQLLSGFPPPLSYSIYGKDNVKKAGLEANVVNDFSKAMQLANEQHKPIMIDFTGWACVNCRKMEENVWTVPAVKEFIEKNYILVSLYVDDRKLLPVAERFTYTTTDSLQKELRTEGDKWATFEAENFGKTSQPLYALLDNDGKLLTYPVAYTPDADKYLKWLECGKDAFDKGK
ncbi:MAG TPA: cytochrome c biogenesis protein CcdA [Chitinophagaceae bacterium]|nr:cytochrome c biogenesis protein CcdA [Chitinophagaceae bacterium]